MRDTTNAYRLVNEFIESEICRKNWRSILSMYHALNIRTIECVFPNNSQLEGFCTYHHIESRPAIYINRIFSDTRITFTKHHECGHVIGMHIFLYPDLFSSNIEKNLKERLELEATIIGRNVFLPAIIMQNLINKVKNLKLVERYYMSTYNISQDYFNVRRSNLLNDLVEINYPEWYNDEIEKELYNFYDWVYVSNIDVKIPDEYHPEYQQYYKSESREWYGL